MLTIDKCKQAIPLTTDRHKRPSVTTERQQEQFSATYF